MGGDEGGKTRDRDADRDDTEEKAMAELIGYVRNNHREAECGRPGRNAVQLGLDGRVTVSLNDAGGKEGVAVRGDDEAEIHQAADENLVVLEDVDGVPDRDPPLKG